MKRKFISELCLNMMTGHSCLLTQKDINQLHLQYEGKIPPFHIYIIGRRPRITINPKTFCSDDKRMRGTFIRHTGEVKEEHAFDVPLPSELGALTLRSEYPHTEMELLLKDGTLFLKTYPALFIGTLGPCFRRHLDLEVLYVGQAFGENGERLAPDRLKNHSTLQGIYAEALHNNPDQDIWITLFSFEMLHVFSFDGTPQEYGTSPKEDEIHRNNLIGTRITDQQQINFTEAALIRYFKPPYNTLYKDTFPNCAHTTYSQCYDLEINSVMVELHTTKLMCDLWSLTAPPKEIHVCFFPLYSKEDRKAIFDIDFNAPSQKG